MLDKDSVVRRTVEQIKELIRNGVQDDDAKLPTERELATNLHVSRSSVREALRILSADGVIEIIPNKGSYVVGVDYKEAIEKMFLENEITEILYLIEVRLAIEPMAASLAAERATEDQIQNLEQCHEELVNKILSKKVEDIAFIDEKFHDLVFQSAHNPLLHALYNFIKKLLKPHREEVLAVPIEAMKAVVEHDAITSAISQHDTKLAMQSMLQHLVNWRKTLFDKAEVDCSILSNSKGKI